MDYKDIIQLVRSKDKKGVEALFTDYGEKLYSYAIAKWFFSEDSAWEMIYKTLDTLLLKLPGYELTSQAHFNNLVFKIFKNNLRQYYRDKKRKEGKIEFVAVEHPENLKGTEVSIGPLDFEDYYENEVLDSALFAHLKVSLEKLDPFEKELVLLRAQNYPYKEIAQMLNTEDEQLKVKYHRALKKLKDQIEKQQKSVV